MNSWKVSCKFEKRGFKKKNTIAKVGQLQQVKAIKPVSERMRAHGDLGVAQKVKSDLTRELKVTACLVADGWSDEKVPLEASRKVVRQPVRCGSKRG